MIRINIELPEDRIEYKTINTQEKLLAALKKENKELKEQLEREKGKWMKAHEDSSIVYCSECQGEYWNGEQYRYCPQCGARMY